MISHPKEWSIRSLEDVAEVRTGLAKGKTDLKDPISLPYLRVANVQDGHLDLSEVKLIQVARSDIERYRLHAGDVVLTEGGDLDPNEKPEKILKPLFDQIWNGFGWPGSVNYGASGERKNKK